MCSRLFQIDSSSLWTRGCMSCSTGKSFAVPCLTLKIGVFSLYKGSTNLSLIPIASQLTQLTSSSLLFKHSIYHLTMLLECTECQLPYYNYEDLEEHYAVTHPKIHRQNNRLDVRIIKRMLNRHQKTYRCPHCYMPFRTTNSGIRTSN
ncbi:hypothetical protein B0H13DRAFT_2664218 [Mycena leptocephala]|nr:hypothetical protein B0H13DRAFT_2664218 [Mycena leptocephala]